MKRYFVLAAVFCAIIVGLVVLRQQSRSKSVPAPPQPKEPAPELARLTPPVFPSPVAAQPAYVVPTISLAFPQSLPEYRVLPTSRKDQAVVLAAAFGFTAEPQSFPGAEGVVYVWNQRNGSLSVVGDPPRVSLTTGAPTAGAVSAVASDLAGFAQPILQKISLPGVYHLQQLPPRYFKASGPNLLESDQGTATVVEVSYQPLLANRPVFGARPNEPGATIRFNAKGELVSLAATLFPPVKESGRSVAVASGEELAGRLTRGEGTMLYLFSDVDKNNFTAPQYAVSSVSVRSLSLGYYYYADAPSLSPVFLVEGSGGDRETGKEVRFMSLVSALP